MFALLYRSKCIMSLSTLRESALFIICYIVPMKQLIIVTLEVIETNVFFFQNKEPSTRKFDQKIQLNLSDEMISNILNNKERYAKFLKRTSTQAVGRFNPWQVVEQ